MLAVCTLECACYSKHKQRNQQNRLFVSVTAAEAGIAEVLLAYQ